MFEYFNVCACLLQAEASHRLLFKHDGISVPRQATFLLSVLALNLKNLSFWNNCVLVCYWFVPMHFV
jgi:hypothetical protein